MYKSSNYKFYITKGFTLIELAVVLVIIGLIISGILAGKHLIEQAQIRRVISTLNEFNTAVGSFKAKYNGIPGDLKNASSFGLNLDDSQTVVTAYTRKTNNDGNGDGFLQGSNNDGNGSSQKFQGEMVNFWVHLSNSRLIKGSYAASPVGCRGLSTVDCDAIPDQSFPTLPIGSGIVAVTGSPQKAGKLQFVIGFGYANNTLTLCGIEAPNNGSSLTQDLLTPIQSYGIDAKLDDGWPDTGVVRVVGEYYDDNTDNTQYFIDDSTLSANDCYSVAHGPYNLTVTSKVCTLRIQAKVQ